jgi:hypothetical protein
MRYLKINVLTPLEAAARERARAIVDGTTVDKLQGFIEKGYIPAQIGLELKQDRGEQFTAHVDTVGSKDMTERALRVYLIGREKEVLKELLTYDEITERIFKRINAKLSSQAEEAEHGNLNPDPHRAYDYRDIFENIAEFCRDIFMPGTLENEIREEYLYYRAQSIIARKAVKELERMKSEFGAPAFPSHLIEKGLAMYNEFQKDASERRAAIGARFPEIALSLDKTLALRSVYRVEVAALEELAHRELLTPKLHATLLEEYRAHANARSLKSRRSSSGRLGITTEL